MSTWRQDAACKDHDPELFSIDDAEELGVEDMHRLVKVVNGIKFISALRVCRECPVVQECEDSAIAYGDHPFGVRGGKDPYKRKGVRAGHPVPIPHDPEHAQKRAQGAWELFRQGRPLYTMNAGERSRYNGIKDGFAQGTETCTWDSWTSIGGTVRPAGEGWIVSQSPCRSVARVIYRQSGKVRDLYANTRHLRYDSSTTPKILVNWPGGIDYC